MNMMPKAFFTEEEVESFKMGSAFPAAKNVMNEEPSVIVELDQSDIVTGEYTPYIQPTYVPEPAPSTLKSIKNDDEDTEPHLPEFEEDDPIPSNMTYLGDSQYEIEAE